MIKAYTWDANRNYSGVILIDPSEPVQKRCTTLAPHSTESHWTGKSWKDGLLSPPTAYISADNLRQELALAYEARMAVIATGYPPSERESWPVQTEEAKALLADPTAPTPWIDAAATARGLDRLELAQRIAAKNAQYRAVSGTLSGIRQRIEDQIDAAGEDQEALKLINVSEGWPTWN